MKTKKIFSQLCAMLMLLILFVSCTSNDDSAINKSQQSMAKNKLASRAAPPTLNDIHGSLTITNNTPFKFNNVRLYCYLPDVGGLPDPSTLVYQEVNILGATYIGGVLASSFSVTLQDFKSTSLPSPNNIIAIVPIKWYFDILNPYPDPLNGTATSDEILNNTNYFCNDAATGFQFTAWKGIYKYGASNAVGLIAPTSKIPILAFTIKYPNEIFVMPSQQFQYISVSANYNFVTSQNVDADGNIRIRLDIMPAP